MRNVTIKDSIKVYSHNNIIRLVEGKLPLETLCKDLLDMNVFTDKESICLYLINNLLNDCNDFEVQFPIKYYTNDKEFEEDDYTVDDSDIEHLNEEYVETLKRG